MAAATGGGGMRATGGAGAGRGGGESIYNWIKHEVPAAEKPARYHSHFDPKKPVTYSSFTVPKRAAGTMGASVKDTVRPTAFLKAGEKTKTLAAAESSALRPRRADVMKKPAIPSRSERPIMGVKSDKNYVVANAVSAILAEAKRAPEAPDYLHKEDYGRVPAYLSEVKAEIEEERELIEKMIAERDAPASSEGEAVARELSEDERAELLAALKAKWDLVNQRYQKMTHQAISSAKSTIGQVRLKETCERELDQLEKDIERLSVKGPIYVVD